MFSNPEKNLKVFGLKEDSIVADLGAGTGYYAIAAGKIASRGKVYAVEIEKDYLDTIRHKVSEAGLKNVEIIWGNVEKPGGSKLGDGIADVVIASNILFQVENKNGFLAEIKRILRPKGQVLFSDWSDKSVMSKVAIAKGRAREMFEKHGFVFDREMDTGQEHYGMIFRKG
ncbi:MAG: class I SAM-dependent methyltransferase [Candidatus Paceibacterota bacterium]|jgi:ubiquinone/menaquinone biosynthesis C-methylase UbiE